MRTQARSVRPNLSADLADRNLLNRHPLVSGAGSLFEAGRLSWRTQYLKAAKRLLIDLAVTKTGLDKPIGFANEFVLALEARDHPVSSRPPPSREEEARRDPKAVRDSKDELLEILDAWPAAKRLDELFADAEHRALDLPDKQRERTIERRRQARALIGSTNPLERFDARQRSIQAIDRGEPVDRTSPHHTRH